jgi:nudix-type nucleoside diphosphatase (YffH/AdpP family)
MRTPHRAILGTVLCLAMAAWNLWRARTDPTPDAAGDRSSPCEPNRAGDHPSPAKVRVLENARILDDWFVVDRARISIEQYDGSMSAPMTRLVFERGDAAAVLLYEREPRCVILVQQFRYPAYIRDSQRGWLWEIVAGVQEPGQSPEQAARREAWEEAGYALDAVQYIMTIYPSPGGATERVHLFLAPVTPDQHTGKGGGLPQTEEDIRICSLGLDEALQMIERGEIVDAKTIIALQYLAAHRTDL